MFDGCSFVLNADGKAAHHLPDWEEHLRITHWRKDTNGWVCDGGELAVWEDHPADIYSAMVLALRDYVDRNRFPGVVLGLSGGIDSAICAAIAADALGPERVWCVMLPSRFTSQLSLDLATECAQMIGCRYDTIPINPAVMAFDEMLAGSFADQEYDITEENVQSRIRGVTLMALSNKFGPMLLTTGNKSEMSVGYATLYGDMAGGFAVIKDVPKTMVYELSHLRNAAGKTPLIPKRVLDRPLAAVTIVDMRAVGPGVWNSWKRQLLQTLHDAAEEQIRLGHVRHGRSERVAAKKALSTPHHVPRIDPGRVRRLQPAATVADAGDPLGEALYLLKRKQAVFPEFRRPEFHREGRMDDRTVVFSRAVWKHWGSRNMVIPDLATSAEKFVEAVERGNAACRKYFPNYTLYCVGIRLNAGMVFLSDSRTNAGLDQISTFRKMIVYEKPGDRLMVLLSAGNLSISQSVREILQVEKIPGVDESGRDRPTTIWNAQSMFDAARVLGSASLAAIFSAGSTDSDPELVKKTVSAKVLATRRSASRCCSR